MYKKGEKMSTTKMPEMEKYKQDFLKDYHSQFAQNQNHHQTTVITVFTGFIALIVVFIYATLYQETYLLQINKPLVINYPYIVTDELYVFLVLFIVMLFSFIYVYICQVAYSFRRDQNIIRRIREECGVQGTIFKGYGKVKKILYPPDFYLILLLFILLSTVITTAWIFDFLILSTSVKWMFSLPFVVMFISYFVYLSKYRSLDFGKRNKS